MNKQAAFLIATMPLMILGAAPVAAGVGPHGALSPMNSEHELAAMVEGERLAVAPSTADLFVVASAHLQRIHTIDVVIENRSWGTADFEFFPKAIDRLRLDRLNPALELIRVDSTLYKLDPANPKNTLPWSTRTRAWDGKVDTSLVVCEAQGTRNANIDNIRQLRTSPDIQEFLNINLLALPLPEKGTMPSRSVVAALSSPWASVRENSEEIDGHACWVVDWRHPSSNDVLISLWLDSERGCIPLKQVVPGPLSYQATKVVEALPQVWIITEATRVLTGENGTKVEGHVVVQSDETGKPRLAVNGQIDPSVFTPTIPPGFEVGRNGVYEGKSK
jgi:hypothetical protein